MAKKEEKIYKLKVGDKVFEYLRPPLLCRGFQHAMRI